MTRRRPRYHFTAESGWINDPHGIVHHGGRYHLFFQHVPDQTVWGPNCHWGHAVGQDLAHWSRRPIALSPEDEGGCWTGAAVRVDAGPPTIYYTSVHPSDWGAGQVRTAVTTDADLRHWTRPPGSLVLAGPPKADVAHFRDPFLWRTPDGQWRMLMGCGLPDAGGAALQYSSADAITWTYDGVLCSRSTMGVDAQWTGSVWECPQLFELGGSWVLVFGVFDNDTGYFVAAAVGEYDGRVFRPRTCTRLTAGDAPYATTTFEDADGRRCLMHWLREDVARDLSVEEWAGALSVAQVLELDSDLLVVTPHPDVAGLRTGGVRTEEALVLSVGDAVSLTAPGATADIVVAVVALAEHTSAELALTAAGQPLVTVRVDWSMAQAVVARPGAESQPCPVRVRNGTDLQLRLLLDEDILEVFAGENVGGWRLSESAGPVDVTLRVTSGRAQVTEFAVHAMAEAVQ